MLQLILTSVTRLLVVIIKEDFNFSDCYNKRRKIFADQISQDNITEFMANVFSDSVTHISLQKYFNTLNLWLYNLTLNAV